jgi:hypothetical protein
MRRHLGEVPLNPLHFNPDLPDGFCDAIAAMMHKNHESRTPTAAAVADLLAEWRDERATRLLAEAAPPASGIHVRGGTPVPPPVAALPETASFNVLDEVELPANPLDSPSQISQGTVSMTSDMEDTLAGVHIPRRAGQTPRNPVVAGPRRRGWRKPLLWSAVAVLAVAGAVGAWLAGVF